MRWYNITWGICQCYSEFGFHPITESLGNCSRRGMASLVADTCRGKPETCYQEMDLFGRHMAEQLRGDVLNKMFHVLVTQYISSISMRVALGMITPDAFATIPEFTSQYSTRMTEMVFRSVDGIPGIYFMTAFDVVALIASIVLLVLAVRSGFMVEKKPFVALLAMLIVAVAVGACYWAFLGMGYQVFGRDLTIPNVPVTAVLVVGHLSAIVLLLVFSLFAWVVIAAVLDTFYPSTSRRVHVASAVGFASVAVAVTAYAVAMTVLRSMPTETFTIDATNSLIPGVSCLFAACLAGHVAAGVSTGGGRQARNASKRAHFLLCVGAVGAAVFGGLCLGSLESGS